MNCFSFFLFFDIFGVGYNFLIDGRDKQKTATGALMTIFYFLIVVGLFFGFGLDLYQRKNPKVSLNKETVPYSKYGMSNSNFTLAYRLEDDDGLIIDNDSIIKKKVIYYSYELVDGVWNNTILEIIESKSCHDFSEISKKEEYFNISLKNWYCIDFENRTWGGNWDGNFIYVFQIIIEQCMNSTENNNTCSSQEEISKSFITHKNSGNLYYSQMSLSVQPALNDFSNPLKPYLVNYYQTLDLNLSKNRIQTFKVTSVNNDVGWFFSDVKEESVFDFDFAESDINFKKKWEEPILFSTSFYLGNNSNTFSRSYTKIQEVIASIGGFAKLFYTLSVLLFNYAQKSYRNLIILNKVKFDTKNFSEMNIDKIESLQKINKQETVKVEVETSIKNKIKYVEIKFSNLICFKLCRKKYKQSINDILIKYSYYNEYIANKFEILSYFNLFKDFENLKKMILTKNQRNYLKESLHKIKIKNDNIDEKMSKEETSQKQPLRYSQNYIIKK
jgi:hypothetical protein